MAPRKIAKLTQSTCIFFLLILSLATTAQCQTNKNVVNPVQSAQTEPQQILVLGSYLPGLPISENIRSGILAALQEGVFGFAHIFIEHLDFTCAPASELRTDIVNLLHHKLAQKRVGVVITIGAPATDFMTREGKSLFPDAMVITLISPNYQVLSAAVPGELRLIRGFRILMFTGRYYLNFAPVLLNHHTKTAGFDH